MSATTPQPLHCPNCGHPVSLPDDVYCRHCGQETRLEAPTVLGFVREFTGQYLSTRGAMARSLKALLVPGRLTEEYLKGRRRHYVLPMRLLLSLAFALVVLVWVLRTALPLPPEHPLAQMTDPRHAHAPALESTKAYFHAGGLFTHVGQKDGEFYCRGLTASSCQSLQDQWRQAPQQLAKLQAQAISRVASSSHWLALLQIPWLALMTRWLYARRQKRYAEHMVLALHLGAGVALINLGAALFMQLTPGLGLASTVPGMVAIFAYMAVGWQRILGGRWWLAVVRMLVLLLGWLIGNGLLTAAMMDLFWWSL